MKVLIHIYNYMDDLRGGYISPVDQACQYRRYEPIFVYAFENRASELARTRGLVTVVSGDERLRRFFDTLRLKSLSVSGIIAFLRHTALLVRCIRSNAVRVVHVQNFESLILCYVAAKITHSILVLHVRGDGPFERVQVLLRLPDHVITVSETLRRSLLSRFKGQQLERLQRITTVIENGIALPKDTDPADTDTLNVLMVGALNAVKGQMEFIRDVWPLVRSRCAEPIQLVVVGGAPDATYHARLLEVIDECGYTDVQLVGLDPDVGSWYRRAQIVVIYSIYEGLPRVALEAMSFGRPVVATRIVGNSEVVRDGENGLLVDRSNPEHTADAICSLLEDKALRVRLGNRGREDMLAERFSIRRSAREIESFYDEVLEIAGNDRARETARP